MLFVSLTLFGLLIALRPLGITAILLLLAGRRGTIRSLSFAVGWVVTIVVIGVAVVLIFKGAEQGSSPHAVSHAAAVLEFALGLVALAAAGVLLRRSRARLMEERPPSRWMARIGNVGIGTAALAGAVAVSHVTVAAASIEIYRAHLSPQAIALAFVWLTIVGTSSIVLPVILVGVAPDRYRPRLARLATTVNAHADTIAVALIAILGVYLTARGMAATV